jgi:ATP-dependent Lon protease
MQIGGLKEKTMAAPRHGISTVIIPQDNLRDLEEIDQTVRHSLNFVAARTVDTVLETALVHSGTVSAPILSDIPENIKTRSRKPSIRQ